MSNETIPTIPADWLAHSGIIPAGDGMRTHARRVVHAASPGSHHPFVIHTAYMNDDCTWGYVRGSYFFTKEEALAAFYKEFHKVA